MRTTPLLAIALSLACFTPAFAQGERGGGQAAPTQTIDARTAGFEKLDGFMPLYWDERTGKVLMEITRFDTELLYFTDLAAGLGSNDIGLDRGQSGPLRRGFQRDRPKVLLIEPNYRFRAISRNPDERARSRTRSRVGAVGLHVAAESRARAGRCDDSSCAMRTRASARLRPGELPARPHAQRDLPAAHQGLPEEHRDRRDPDLLTTALPAAAWRGAPAGAGTGRSHRTRWETGAAACPGTVTDVTPTATR